MKPVQKKVPVRIRSEPVYVVKERRQPWVPERGVVLRLAGVLRKEFWQSAPVLELVLHWIEIPGLAKPP